MNAVAPRHGTVSDFLALTYGLSVARVAEILRCCTRTIRNYVAGRSPISWHRVELLRMIAQESNRGRNVRQCASVGARRSGISRSRQHRARPGIA
ncbi:hypothetical protein [Burkholderia ubonensis]|uniref:hypothetical protein n=1 Tax=Burkholderia ubonensis TaxID=101571 RepID=UPI000AAF347D|nr:hypothetical protein [Burkholderia ubonensis]